MCCIKTIKGVTIMPSDALSFLGGALEKADAPLEGAEKATKYGYLQEKIKREKEEYNRLLQEIENNKEATKQMYEALKVNPVYKNYIDEFPKPEHYKDNRKEYFEDFAVAKTKVDKDIKTKEKEKRSQEITSGIGKIARGTPPAPAAKATDYKASLSQNIEGQLAEGPPANGQPVEGTPTESQPSALVKPRSAGESVSQYQQENELLGGQPFTGEEVEEIFGTAQRLGLPTEAQKSKEELAEERLTLDKQKQKDTMKRFGATMSKAQQKLQNNMHDDVWKRIEILRKENEKDEMAKVDIFRTATITGGTASFDKRIEERNKMKEQLILLSEDLAIGKITDRDVANWHLSNILAGKGYSEETQLPKTGGGTNQKPIGGASTGGLGGTNQKPKAEDYFTKE